MKTGRTRLVTTPLTVRERLQIIWAGMSGLALRLVLDQIRAATLDAPVRSRPRGQRLQSVRKRHKVRAQVVAAETAEATRHRGRLEGRLATAQGQVGKLREKLASIRGRRPQLKSVGWWLALALVALVGHLAFDWQTLADATGVDLSEGITGVSALPLVLSLTGTALAVLATFWSGAQATDRKIPLRRYAGWSFLTLLGLALAVLRSAVSPDGSFAFAAFGFVVTLVAGWAAGESHWRLSAYLAKVSAWEQEFTTVAAELREAERAAGDLAAGVDATDTRRRALAEEADAISRPATAAPAGELTVEDRQRLLQARLSAARYYYRFGAKLAGRTLRRTEDGDA